MYERFYELRERPFALSPDPEYLYPSRVHREALDYLRYGLESQAGFVVITGEIGSGKTTLLQTLLRGLDTQTTVGRIVNTMLEPRELLETIMIDFGLDPAGKQQAAAAARPGAVPGRPAARRPAGAARHRRSAEPEPRGARRAADALEPRDREIEAAADRAGRPAEPARQAGVAPELEQLRQRITVSYHLPPLDRGRNGQLHQSPAAPGRARRAAGVPARSHRRRPRRSRGVPRIINVICDAALVFGYAEERRQIDLPLMREVLAELETTGVLPSPLVPSGPVMEPVPGGTAAACAGRIGHGSAARGRICDLRTGASTGGSRQPGRNGTGGAAGGRNRAARGRAAAAGA